MVVCTVIRLIIFDVLAFYNVPYTLPSQIGWRISPYTFHRKLSVLFSISTTIPIPAINQKDRLLLATKY